MRDEVLVDSLGIPLDFYYGCEPTKPGEDNVGWDANVGWQCDDDANDNYQGTHSW